MKKICFAMQRLWINRVDAADDIAVFTGKFVCENGPVTVAQLGPNVLVDQHARCVDSTAVVVR